MTIDIKNEAQHKTISVVIASGAGGVFLARCLASLAPQVQFPGIEVIVVDRCGEDFISGIEAQFPFVQVIRTDNTRRPSVPELRAIGSAHATGEVVAVIEEHCIAPAGWIAAIEQGFQETDAGIGGPILDDSYSKMMDWAVYFSEYHNYLPPWQDGPRFTLNGANIAYRRNKLLEYEHLLGSGYWEVVLHPLLAQDGGFWAVAKMGVRHTGPFAFGYYIEQRYLLSRVWGGTQRETVGLKRRILYLITGPFIPFLLLLRIFLRVRGQPKYLGKFFRALPLLIPILVAYVWGEWLGYLVGVGDALDRVE